MFYYLFNHLSNENQERTFNCCVGRYGNNECNLFMIIWLIDQLLYFLC